MSAGKAISILFNARAFAVDSFHSAGIVHITSPESSIRGAHSEIWVIAGGTM
jgi:hypothetical protein